MYDIIAYYMDRKLRIACFHGFGTNGDFMKLQMKHINKLLAPFADCVYLNGFNTVNKNFVEEAVTNITKDASLYSWFEYKSSTEKELVDITLKNVAILLDEHGPFDGMIGFSQGGSMVNFLILLKTLGLLKHQHLDKIKFGILICGIMWRWKVIDPELKVIGFPTLHMVSKSDFCYRVSLNASVKYVNPVVIHHGEGHKIPRLSQEDFNLVMRFIQKAMKEPGTVAKL